MLLCLVLQIADAKQMQDANAECRCSMQMQDASCIAECKADAKQKSTPMLSQTACAPEALGRIQSLRAFRRAWDLGSRALGFGEGA